MTTSGIGFEALFDEGDHRALIDYTRERVLAGARASQIARELRAQARQAFARLERGLGEYAVKGS